MELKHRPQSLHRPPYLLLLMLGLLLQLGFLYPCQPLAAAPLDQSGATIRIGVKVNEPPYSYVDSNGMIKGFNVDMVRAVAIEMGIDIELYAQTESDLYNSLLNHGLDAIISNHARDNSFIISQGLIESQDAIFVRADNQYISGLEGFWTSPVAINMQSLTTLISAYLDKYDAQSPKIVMDQEHGFLLLMSHEVDSYIGNKNAGMYLIQKWNQEDYIKVVGDPFNVSTYAFYTNASEKSLMNRLNNGLAAVANNGTNEKIYEKWFGESAASYDKKARKYFLIIALIALISLCILIFALKWRTVLKKEVEHRTLELNQANETLRQQQYILRDKDQFKEDILNSVSTGIITYNHDGAVTSVNAKARQALALGADAAVCPPCDDLTTLSFLDQDKLADVLENGSFYTDLEGCIVVNSETKLLSYQIYPLRNSRGESSGAIANFEDNSKERRLEEEMTKVDKMKSLDLLVSEFVHEIRTPLTSIKTMTELLPNKIDNLEFRRNLIEIVTMEVSRLDSMVTTLSEYAKPWQKQSKPIDIKDLINSVLLLLQRKFHEKNITLENQLTAGLMVYGDNMQLMQVFINLILNSLESLSNDGRLTIVSRLDQSNVEITIADNGPGISTDNLEKVTEPFFTTRSKGTGLGLYICRKLLDNHQGQLLLQSRLGQGTTVKVILPKLSL